jgi:Mn-dependent DtxR family transcriptional regulator
MKEDEELENKDRREIDEEYLKLISFIRFNEQNQFSTTSIAPRLKVGP